MAITLDGTTGITTPEIISTGGPIVVDVSAPDNSLVVTVDGKLLIGNTTSRGSRFEVERTDSDNAIADFKTNNASGDVIIRSSGGFVRMRATGTNEMAFMSAGTERMRIDATGNLLFNSGYGSVAVAYGCRAWVNFNGTGTVAILGSGNVSSITDNGVGLYTVNFTTAMPDTNFVVACSGGDYTTGTALLYVQERNAPGLRTVNSIAIATGYINTGAAALQDNATNMVTVFR